VVDIEGVIAAFWQRAESRDWPAFGELLAPDVRYEAPQTRERVRGREAYVRFNAEFPGDWHLGVERIVGSGREGVSWIEFRLDGEQMTGISFFTLDDDGLIVAIKDFWPDSYEPPANRAHLTERY
jgi:hypothetical protein